jgi:eukaryotic-like serine/threonine-protein kinase
VTSDPENPSDPIHSSDVDLRLATLVEELQQSLRQGDIQHVEALCQEHLDLETDLRELWAAMVAATVAGVQFRMQDEYLEHQSPVSSATTLSCQFNLPVRQGDFELTEELGRGGMGVVYRAHQISLDREVALKMILPGRISEPEHVERFQQEAEAAAQLDHPGIISIYEVGKFAEQPFFCMQLVAGQTIGELGQKQFFKQQQSAAMLLEVSEAIQYAHRRGVLHRDLKPSNIMVDGDGKTHVTDFGLAKRFTHDHDITQTGAILGTPAYMAPEQASGGRGSTGVHTDIYALGAILYFMVTGRPPFSAATPVDTVLLVLDEEVTPPRVLNARIDRDLEMIILKCLQKPVNLRYRSAQQLVDDLRAYLHNEPISANQGRFSSIIAAWFSETPHAAVLQKWGVLWMWHSVVLLIACIVTNAMFLSGFDNRLYYSTTWTLGLGTWAIVFWKIRHLRGSVLFVERQIAHAWAASMIAIALLFPIESLLGLKSLQTAPVLALISGMVFLFKAGILTGKFYLQAAALFLTSLIMAAFPKYALTLFGCVSALCFFIPGWHYHRHKN